MANITKKRLDMFVSELTKADGSSGNSTLRSKLGWDEKTYWAIQGRLIEEGKIAPGRGRGGSVRLVEEQVSEAITEAPYQPDPLKSQTVLYERDLYEPLRNAIEERWINRLGLDHVLVSETHSLGSKDTGGTYTRPDITAAGIRRYIYLPKRLEIVTFEVKPANQVSIMGVLEAIAHREAAHRSYVLYATTRADFDNARESERIIELAQKYGIGVMLTEVPSDVETWEILVDTARHEPDPARLDRFLVDVPSSEMKTQLSKWKE